ncbi:hypothetical protein M408DRAFT_328409 [Serendipita vermifera MAFF 305830]|uniref:Glutathione synthetase n=1 Tax=Serendipita vermifera MAFF 305830 TaxID=933852 RepID=A0A0C2WUU1_SERVB|nr:hypothetical protein M408DRAFT_328409 [Serendipita vermifera MAFF 305830]
MPLPKWPPAISPSQLEELRLIATTYALSHGLLYLPPGQQQPPAPSSAIHAPFALFPSPFPRTLFTHAQDLQQIYNVLYARVASDTEFLDRVLSAETAVGRVDEFVGTLWKIWKEVRSEGLVQPLQLGIFRSDYLLHEDGDGMDIKQVEFNTISASFGGLSQAVDGLHRYLMASTGYYSCSPILKESNVPPNNTLAEIVSGLAQAHKAYLQSKLNSASNQGHPAQILFVTQPNERNVFDQRPLEYELLNTYNIRVIRRTFEELATQAHIQDSTRVLLVDTSTSPDPVEVSVVYFRAGYTPVDYPTSTHFDTRKTLERSAAIKCPSLALQLAGSKKVQAVLSRPGVVETFILSDRWAAISQDNPHSFTGEDVDGLRRSWMEMYGLEEEGAIEKARKDAQELVLKPQREGGGNNVYKGHIPEFLDGLSEKEREAWIAMALIKVPKGVENTLVRSGSEPVRANVVCELGIFGWALFGYESDPSTDGKKLKLEEGSGGYLLRTKGEDSDEGGVATGFSVLDSVILVD